MSMGAPLPVGRIANAAILNVPKPEVNADPKMQLVEFCQRKTNRQVKEGDIVYSTAHYSSGVQSMVKLTFLGGQEFAGELAKSVLEAEKNAARQAVVAHQAEIAALTGDSKKRKAPGPPGPPVKAAKVTPGMVGTQSFPIPAGAGAVVATNKSALNMHCSKIIRRAQEKTDLTYDTVPVEGGFQATVRMPCLAGVWATRAFAGEVQPQKSDAEHSAAGIALAAIQRDVQLMAKFAAPAKVKNWRPPSQGGKGQGKGHASQPAMTNTAFAQQASQFQQGQQMQGWDVMPAMPMAFGGGGLAMPSSSQWRTL